MLSLDENEKNYLMLSLIIIGLFVLMTSLLLIDLPNESSLKLEGESIEKNIQNNLDISFSRGVPKKVSENEALITLTLEYPSPRAVSVYEQLPSGFKISDTGSNLDSTKVNDNTYLFEIPKRNNILGTGIIYNLKIDDSVKRGTYEINGWIESEGKKAETPESKIIIVK